jgi:ABC-type bacteriocin/lantibiotic exporter with double-glycine peptidase domain
MAEVRLLAEEADQRHVLRRAWPHLRPHRDLVTAAVAVNLLATLAAAGVPVLVGLAVDAILAGRRTALLSLAGAAIGLVVGRMLLTRSAELMLVRAGEQVMKDLRDAAAERLSAAPLRFLEAHRAGDLLRRLTVEIADLDAFVRGQLPDVISLTGYVAFSTTVLLIYSAPLTLLLAAVFVPLMWLIGRRVRAAAEPAAAAEAATRATVTATVAETLEAREQLQIAGAANEWRYRLAARMAANHRAVRRTQVALSWLETAWIVQGLIAAMLLVVGGAMVGAGTLTVGAVVTFALASRELFGSVDDLSYVAGELVDAKVAVARLLDLLDATDDRGRVGTAAMRPNTVGSLAAIGVSYSYQPDRPVLRDVSVTFAAGERAALVGASGSGKSTLAKLLAGLYAPDAGSIRYAGIDLAELPYGDLRRRLVLVPQQVHLVTGTLADNLALVPGLPGRAEFERAVQSLELAEWVAGLPGGLDTDLGARGARLSAGESQLVGLIRAALLRPEVVILDEATVDLDPATAHRLETAVSHLHVDRTLIVIAHRQATVDRLSRVVRLADGALVSA